MGEDSSGNLSALPFLRRVKISHTPHRNSKYDAGQERQPGIPEYRNICEWKFSKVAVCKDGFGLSHDGGRQVFQRQ